MVSASTSEGGNSQNFSNCKEEALYWKKIAEDSLLQLQRVKEEFEEYQKESVELESELETQLEQHERKVAELLQSNCKLKRDSDLSKERSETREREANINLVKLQQEMTEVKKEREALKKYVRELEQANDDLERSKRVVISTLEEFDVRLNNLIERNAFLESELEEKELSIVTQKELPEVNEKVSIDDNGNDLPAANEKELPVNNEKEFSTDSDESRDSRTLFPIRDTSRIDDSPKRSEYELPQYIETQQIQHSCAKVGADVDDAINKTDDVITTLNRCKRSCINSNNNIALDKSALTLVNEEQRILALDILSDLLSKVGALETKFEPINFKKPTMQKRGSEKSSPLSERSLRIEANSPPNINEKYLNGTKIPRCINNNNLSRFVKLNI